MLCRAISFVFGKMVLRIKLIVLNHQPVPCNLCHNVNGEDVQIQLANGQYLTAKLARDVQVALGQVMNLQVQSNKDNRVVLLTAKSISFLDVHKVPDKAFPMNRRRSIFFECIRMLCRAISFVFGKIGGGRRRLRFARAD